MTRDVHLITEANAHLNAWPRIKMHKAATDVMHPYYDAV